MCELNAEGRPFGLAPLLRARAAGYAAARWSKWPGASAGYATRPPVLVTGDGAGDARRQVTGDDSSECTSAADPLGTSSPQVNELPLNRLRPTGAGPPHRTWVDPDCADEVEYAERSQVHFVDAARPGGPYGLGGRAGYAAAQGTHRPPGAGGTRVSVKMDRLRSSQLAGMLRSLEWTKALILI